MFFGSGHGRQSLSSSHKNPRVSELAHRLISVMRVGDHQAAFFVVGGGTSNSLESSYLCPPFREWY